MRNALTGGFATVVATTLAAPLQPATTREAASELGGVRLVRFGLAGCGEPPELIKVERS